MSILRDALPLSLGLTALISLSACGSGTSPIPSSQIQEVHIRPSQSRAHGESFNLAAKKYTSRYHRKHHHRKNRGDGAGATGTGSSTSRLQGGSDDGSLVADPGASAIDSATSYDLISAQKIPEIPADRLNDGFAKIRDARILTPPDGRNFNRRVSWLYPDDGCFSRADLSASQLQSLGLPRPAKIFSFGNLEAKTGNSPEGVVDWWFHVAAAYRIAGSTGPDGIRVLDPALSAGKPLTLKEWLGFQSDSLDQVTVSACGTYTYEPGDSCESSSPETVQSALTDEYDFLSLEWDRQNELGRDPTSILGDHPPWS